MYNISNNPVTNSMPVIETTPERLEILFTHNLILSAVFDDHVTPAISVLEELAEPIRLGLGESEAVFTHHLGGSIFGDKPSLIRYQNIMNTIEEQWPSLTKLINSQKPYNRIAVFTSSNCDTLKQMSAGGAWGPFSSSEPRLKPFNAGIVLDVNSGQASLKYAGHEWWHEVQSVCNTLHSGKDPRAVPISMSAYFNAVDEKDIVTCWWKGYEKYRAVPLSANDPRHLIYGKPAKYYDKFYKASLAGHQAEAASAWGEFTHELGSYMASARLEHGHEAIKEHAWELAELIDQKLGIRAFTEPCPNRFKTQVLSFAKRNAGRALEVLGLGLDVYHEYTLLPDNHPSRNVHALINGTARNLLGLAAAYTNLSEALFYDTSPFGTGPEAARKIEDAVGKDRLKEILVKGHRAMIREEQLLPMSGDLLLIGEEREIYFSYQNASLRNIQELGQGFITELYDSVKQMIADFIILRSPDPEAYQKTVRTLGVEIKAQLSNVNVWDPKQQEQLGPALLERANRILSEVPRQKSVLPPEQVAATLVPAETDAPAKEDHVAYVIPDPGEPAAEHPFVTALIDLHQEAEKLNTTLETAIREERPVDEETLERINQLTDKSEKVADHLQKEWDKKGEYYERTMQCVGVIANQLYLQFQQDRQENTQSAALKGRQRVIESQMSELRRGAQPEVSYVDVERFAHSEYHPKTLLEVGRETSILLDRLNELQDRRSTREEALDDIEQLFDDMDRNDKFIQERLQRKLKHQRDIGKRLGRLTNILGGAAGIMAACACPPAYVATASTASALSQIGQSIIGKKADRTITKLQKAQIRSLELHQKVAQTAQNRQYELSVIESQIQQVYQILLSQNSLNNKGFRGTLKSMIDDRQRKIEQLEKELKSHQEHLKSVNDTIDREQKGVETAKKNYKKESRRQGNLDKGAQALEKAPLGQNAPAHNSVKLYHQGCINTTQELLDDLVRQSADDKHRLKQEEFLAPMKEQIEYVILEEQRLLDFNRHLQNDEAAGIKAGDLTQLGLAHNKCA